jgi:hypothetical protein
MTCDKIVAARVSGWSDGEAARMLGCVRVRAVLDERAARMLALGNVLRMLIERFDRVGVIERTFTPRRAAAGDLEALKLAAQCRCQRSRTTELILGRAPSSSPLSALDPARIMNPGVVVS